MKWIKWKIAHLLDKLPGTCWANLATWAAWDTPTRDARFRQDWMCRADADCGSCYCGKVKP